MARPPIETFSCYFLTLSSASIFPSPKLFFIVVLTKANIPLMERIMYNAMTVPLFNRLRKA